MVNQHKNLSASHRQDFTLMESWSNSPTSAPKEVYFYQFNYATRLNK